MRRARVHPDRAEREAATAECRLEQRGEVEGGLAEQAGVADLRPRRERAREVARDRHPLTSPWALPAGTLATSSRWPCVAQPVDASAQIRDPTLQDEVEAVAVRHERDEHVAGAAAGDLGLAVVPEP